MYDICDGEITVNDGFPLFMFPLNVKRFVGTIISRPENFRTLEDHDGLRFEQWNSGKMRTQVLSWTLTLPPTKAGITVSLYHLRIGV